MNWANFENIWPLQKGIFWPAAIAYDFVAKTLSRKLLYHVQNLSDMCLRDEGDNQAHVPSKRLRCCRRLHPNVEE
jgi:hypothetical protein